MHESKNKKNSTGLIDWKNKSFNMGFNENQMSTIINQLSLKGKELKDFNWKLLTRSIQN